MTTAGIILAAGAGRRMGKPKALLRTEEGISWARHSYDVLRAADVAHIVVVLGAEADRVGAEFPGAKHSVDRAASPDLVVADSWRLGIGASLGAGLRHLLADRVTDAALVTLVDTPGVSSAVVHRLLDAASGQSALARASYNGVPLHPVLLGRDHWGGIIETAQGDTGARDYLRDRADDVRLIECADIGSGIDIDTPEQLTEWNQ
ncbi:nucleotidyltransferase family protein [Saxibacter everestensis]|uniref:Nucleotidyltransferase family protein n=1 Tax=Saxibacter everestensis TaxID=2909229 RepID=A0ABY8QVK6_9MICO|nr:nucleotidyltransferase family protein [Brevibacteriaceae bacterium ZFBP1038]